MCGTSNSGITDNLLNMSNHVEQKGMLYKENEYYKTKLSQRNPIDHFIKKFVRRYIGYGFNQTTVFYATPEGNLTPLVFLMRNFALVVI